MVKIRPGDYQIERPAEPGSEWLSISCFEACIALPHEVSGSATVQ
jgi:hypothetical protein